MTDRDDTHTLADADLLGDFQLLDRLGGGGMGTVYRARQLSMDRAVAVKILHEHLASDSAFVERFYREAHASGKLTHPNIIRGIAAGKAGPRFYFAMEFVDGETASDLLQKSGRLAIGEVVRIGLEVARALEHAHSRQVVHRDIKPSNIMIDREGVVKLADLGLAKARADDSALTQAGGVYGTPAYMAPEQISDAAGVDRRCDIYALGVTLYHLLTGAKPFAGSSVAEVLNAKRTGVYRPIREYEPAVPETVERIIDKMMRCDLNQRFQSAGEVAAAFEATGLAGVRPAVRGRAAGRRWARPLLAIGAGGLALLAALALLSLQRGWPPWGMRSEPPPPEAPARPVAAAAPQEAKQVALGVMLFRMHGGGADDEWKREALRDGLNAQLSGLSQVKVYSKEFIDFLITRKALTEIEAATQLGIKKMLSGSVVVRGIAIQVETHIVDVSSGVIEVSYTTMGSEEDFLALPSKLAREVIARLDLPVTEQERQVLLAQREGTTIEALKLLLEAEGGIGKNPAPAEPRSDAGVSPPSPRARLDTGWLSVALGEEVASPENAITDLLERYRGATEARKIETLAELYVDFSKEQEEAQQRYFQNVRDLRIAIDAVDIAVVGDEAVVSYTRTDDFIDARTSRPMHVAIRLTKLLRNDAGTWKLVGGE